MSSGDLTCQVCNPQAACGHACINCSRPCSVSDIVKLALNTDSLSSLAVVCGAVHACTHCLVPSAVFASVPYLWLICCLVTKLPAECSCKEAVAGRGPNIIHTPKVQVAAYHHYQAAAGDVRLEDAALPDTINS